MGIEDIASNLDINKFMDYAMDLGFKVVKTPFQWWNNLPAFVRYIFIGIIVALAVFLCYITFKYRQAWRYFE